MLLIGYADYQTGVDVSLNLFYPLPVETAALGGSRVATLGIALACAATWFVTNSALLRVYEHPAVLFWNTGVRMAMFSIVGLLLVRTRETRDNLQCAVDEKTKLLQEEMVQRKKNEREFFALVQRNREAVAFELHDGLAQFLTAIAMKTKVLERELADHWLPQKGAAEKSCKALNRAVGETREIARGLSPLDTDASDLVAAMRRLAAETQRATSA